MAKDDYHVIVYYLLSYLYYCLKGGIQPENKLLSLEEYPVQINEAYLAFIYSELMRKGFITGVIYGNVKITSDGIEYLQYNGTMGKVWKGIQESGGIILQLISMFK